MRLAAAVLCFGLVCCAPAPGPAAKLTMADIQPILEPLTYREIVGKKCGIPDTAVKTAFIADLKASGASPELLRQAEAEAERIASIEPDALDAYVCTPEFFESTATMASFARMAWAELKNRKP